MKPDSTIRIGDRFFAYKVGTTFIGVWEDLRTGEAKASKASRLSFTIPRPDVVDKEQIRDLILQKMSAAKRECER